jgi:hypothetical protein
MTLDSGEMRRLHRYGHGIFSGFCVCTVCSLFTGREGTLD